MREFSRFHSRERVILGCSFGSLSTIGMGATAILDNLLLVLEPMVITEALLLSESELLLLSESESLTIPDIGIGGERRSSIYSLLVIR